MISEALFIFLGGVLTGLIIMFTVYGGMRRLGVSILTYMLERGDKDDYVMVKLSRADAHDYMGVPTVTSPGVGKAQIAKKVAK